MAINTIDEMIAILQAYKEGKQLECRSCGNDGGQWHEVIEPVFAFNQTEYRIKSQGKKKLYQFVCQNTGDKRYFVTANLMEDANECLKVYRYCRVVKRLEHTMTEVEVEE